MASSPSSPNPKRFDVFLSFRGEDTRRTFVSHLEKELKSKAINTFKDDHKLQTGDHISDELIKAIEESKFAVVVISKHYASSGWCLDELERIIECEEKGVLTVVPIFYEVDPSDVRYQKGTFAEAFEMHNARRSSEKVQKWREALNKVSGLSGIDSRERSDDAALVSEIVTDISQRLISMAPRDVAGIIGMDAHLIALDPLLNMGSDDEVRMIGIWGMGGVGKTTIAGCLYNIHKWRFRSHCFIDNVKKIHREQGLEKLKRQFLSKILHDENLMSETIEIDSNTIKSRLCGQRVLAILDDVDDLDQLKALAKSASWFGLGSRILITTRESDLFIKHGIQLVHKVKCLGWDTALSLFNRFAFGENQVSSDFTVLSNRALELVKGLPLAIKVLGNALRGRNIREWKSIIHRLEKVPDKTIMACLKVSYDGLDDRDKNIFLTIACIFSVEYVSRLLQLVDDEDCEVHRSLDVGDFEVDRSLDDEDCEVITSLKTLTEKALIDISEDGLMTVHDLIQDMAQEVVRQQSNGEPKGCRFLQDSNDIQKVLAHGKEADAVEGISLDMSKIKSFPVRIKSFESMPNLKFLVIRNTSSYKGDFFQLCAAINHLPQGLKLLDWEDYPLTTLPSTFDAECLVDLRLPRSRLEKLSEKTLTFKKLRWLELPFCHHLREILKFPENIMEHNIRGTNISELPDIPRLATLEFLNLSGCIFSEIPNTIGNLTALKVLHVRQCLQLRSIPDMIGNLASLETLDLQSCVSLLEIPSSIGYLTTLRELDLSVCEKLTSIPDTIGNLASLETLDLQCCVSLLEIPSSIGYLTTLRKLDLSVCEKLTSIPDTIGSLTKLKDLKVSGCRMLLEIPSTIGNLTLLEELHLCDCISMRRIPDLIGNFTSLRCIKILKCEMLSEISSTIGNFTTLRRLQVVDCEKLQSVPSTIGNLTSLEELSLSGCTMLVEIPSTIGNLKALLYLNLSNCENLRSVPSTMGSLTNLIELAFSGCKMLYEIPCTIGNLPRLAYLSLPDGIDIDCLWGIVKECCYRKLELTNLFYISTNLEARWEIALENQTLEVLYLSRERYDPSFAPLRWTTLAIFKDLRKLSLCNLNIWEIPDDFGYLQALQHLDLSGNDFKIIPASIKQLPLLEQLVLSCCWKLQLIPELSPGLKYLYANDCYSLRTISSIYRHPFHEIMLINCFKLGRDPQQFIQQMIFSMPIHKGEIKMWACFSESKLPDWFTHQSTEQSLTIPCSQMDSGFKPVGFVAGIVVAHERLVQVSNLNVHCGWHGDAYQSRHVCFDPKNLPTHVSDSPVMSDLLFVFSCNFGEEKSCEEISFHFELEYEMKRCGIRLCFVE